MGNEVNPILKSLIPVVEGLGKTLGKHCEVVLHDISKTESSVIAIENGHITGRVVGSPVTDLLMEIINEKKEENMDLNYITKTKDGKQLKSSTMIIRDQNDEIVGALCINIDLTNVEIAQNLLNDIAHVEEVSDSNESFPEDTGDFLDIMIKNSFKKVDKPINLLDKTEKLKIVSYLDQNNIFHIKGAVDILAREMGVSKYSIYNYLDEVRVSEN